MSIVTVLLIEEDNRPMDTECHYGPPVVGPPLPAHVYLCGDEWRVGAFEAGVDDTPGTANCPGDVSLDCAVGVLDLIALITGARRTPRRISTPTAPSTCWT